MGSTRLARLCVCTGTRLVFIPFFFLSLCVCFDNLLHFYGQFFFLPPVFVVYIFNFLSVDWKTQHLVFVLFSPSCCCCFFSLLLYFLLAFFDERLPNSPPNGSSFLGGLSKYMKMWFITGGRWGMSSVVRAYYISSHRLRRRCLNVPKPSARRGSTLASTRPMFDLL